MKSFDEWFEERYKTTPNSDIKNAIREECRLSWYDAQEAQRDSDADMIRDEFSYIEDYDVGDGFMLAERVRNNRGE